LNECVADDEEEQQDEGNDELTWYSYDMEDVDNMWKEACAEIVSFNGVCRNTMTLCPLDHCTLGDKNGTSSRANLPALLSLSGFPLSAISSCIVVATMVIGFAVFLMMPNKVESFWLYT